MEAPARSMTSELTHTMLIATGWNQKICIKQADTQSAGLASISPYKLSHSRIPPILNTMRNQALTLSLLLWLVLPAYSHAILLSATPTAGEVCQGPDVRIKLRFNSRVD